MARINLLPWRQEARERKNREFITLVVGVFLLSLLAAGAAWSYFNSTLDSQREANEKIKQENTKLDKQLAEIDSLEKQRDEMLARMKVIQDLQGRRPVPVRVWSDIAKSIPPQMYLNNMKRENDTITFKGKADNANVVAAFMRNLDATPWLENAALKSISQPQATPYAPISAPTATTTPANANAPAPRPVYPEDSYIEFVVTSTIKKSSDIAGSASTTAVTKVVTTTSTSTTATTVLPMSAPAPVSAVASAPPASVPSSAPAVKPATSSTPVISNAPVSNSTTTTTTTTKERSNG